ncbi:META domain-containing protein [Salegentibacter chungangensis]|uniref:META domain-containing protein n=1 Tax=Salegentibacter chungangensis TaxID=1335724 RepID=A0ABW3NNM1_9FLAO
MKKMIFILSLILFVSCGENEKKEKTTDKAENTEKPTEEIKTSLSELRNQTGSYKIIKLANKDLGTEEILLEFDGDSQKISGNLGCNDFVSAFKLTEDRVKFDPPIGTKMFCEGKMKNEESLGEILPKITRAKINEEELVFLSKDNEVLLSLEKTEQSE